MRRIQILTAVTCLALSPVPSNAQNLAELLPRLVSEAVTMPSTVGTVAGNPHEAHFLPSAAQLVAPYAMNGAVVGQLATFPIGSSSGGFTYNSDSATGFPVRSSGNFGPSFTERALVIGKGKFSAGLNFQRVSFQRFEDLDLNGGPIFYLQHNDCCPNQAADGTPILGTTGPSVDVNPFFEGDLVRTSLNLKAWTETTVLFANYGLSDQFDLALSVPFVRVKLEASMSSELIRLATAASPAIHSFGGSSPNSRTTKESGTASGIGDILLRGKYRMVQSPGGGLALAVDVRLPTGDKENLLGTGATQVKGALVFSRDYGSFSPRLNVGYTLSNGSMSSAVGTYQLGDEVPVPITGAPNAYTTVFRQNPQPTLDQTQLQIPDEINYTGGFSVQAGSRTTFNADMIGRTLRGVYRFDVTSRGFNYRLATGGAVLNKTYTDVLDIRNSAGPNTVPPPPSDSLTLLLGAVGAKFNIPNTTLLLNVNVLFPLTKGGLQPKTTVVAGIDYAF